VSLDQYCFLIVCKAKSRKLYFADFLLLLYNTGIRVSEVNPNLWTLKSQSIYELQPRKGNNPREISKDDLPPSFINYLIDNLDIAYRIPYSSFIRAILFLQPAIIRTAGNKNIISHIFRHNYAKKLKTSGYSDIMIQTILGEKNLSSALNYIYSDIQII
jgi:site-specific recombinase XerD